MGVLNYAWIITLIIGVIFLVLPLLIIGCTPNASGTGCINYNLIFSWGIGVVFLILTIVLHRKGKKVN